MGKRRGPHAKKGIGANWGTGEQNNLQSVCEVHKPKTKAGPDTKKRKRQGKPTLRLENRARKELRRMGAKVFSQRQEKENQWGGSRQVG